jgi:plastocyanin
MALPAFDKDLAISTLLPAHAIGEELPSEGVGSVRSREWKAMIGGFTQSQYAQTLAFPPGTKITIHNLSKTTAHTFDVVKVISGPPATFPRHPALSFSARGGDHLKAGYASGIIKPGHSVMVILEKGIYLIGCAFHYGEGMRDVLVVEDHARPGPQASPSPSPVPSPTSTPTPTVNPSATPTPYTSPTPSPSPTPTSLAVSPSSVNVCINMTACTTPPYVYSNTASVSVKLNGTPVNANVNDSACSQHGYATVTTGSSTGLYTVTGEGSHYWSCMVLFSTNGGNQGSLSVTVWNY